MYLKNMYTLRKKIIRVGEKLLSVKFLFETRQTGSRHILDFMQVNYNICVERSLENLTQNDSEIKSFKAPKNRTKALGNMVSINNNQN